MAELESCCRGALAHPSTYPQRTLHVPRKSCPYSQEYENDGTEYLFLFRTGFDYADIINNVKTQDLWRDDKLADHCFVCSNQFTFSLRRHHCRGCGEICCHTCTSTRRTLPVSFGYYEDEQRVCKSCVSLLDSNDPSIRSPQKMIAARIRHVLECYVVTDFINCKSSAELMDGRRYFVLDLIPQETYPDS